MQPVQSVPFDAGMEPPLVRDEDFTEEFWRLFPDGNVPIVAVPMGTPDVDEWPEFMRKFDLAQEYDVQRIDDLAGQWVVTFHATKRGGTIDNEGMTNVEARDAAFGVARELRDLTLGLLAEGLSLHGIARYIGLPTSVVAEAYTMQHVSMVDALLRADLLADNALLSSKAIAERTGYSESGVRRLRKVRGITVARVGQGNVGRPDYQSVMARADELFDQGMRKKAALKALYAERPDTREWLTLGVMDAAEKRWRKRQAVAAVAA